MIQTFATTALSKPQAAAFEVILEESAKDPWLGGSVEDIIKRPTVVVITDNDIPIGFFCPKRQSWDGVNHWRAGALYLTRSKRGQGIMRQVLRKFFNAHMPGLAWIDDRNTGSLHLFEGMGFKRSKARPGADGEPGHWWLLTTKPNLSVEGLEPSAVNNPPQRKPSMNPRNRAFAAAFSTQPNHSSQQIANEDWNSFKNKVSNFMSIFEHDWGVGIREAKEIKTAIAGYRQVLAKKKGDIRPDAPEIKLRAYAKWLSMDGKMISEPKLLVQSIASMLPLVEAFGKSWWDAYEQMLDYAEVSVLRKALDNPRETREKMRKTFELNQPKGFQNLLKHNKRLTSPIDDGENDVLASGLQMGEWYGVAHGVHWGYVEGTFPITARKYSPVIQAEMQILDKDAIEHLLDGIDHLLEKLGFDEFRSVERAQNSLMRAARPYTIADNLDADQHGNIYVNNPAELALVGELEGYVEHLLEMASHNNAQNYVLQTCMVVMKWIDQSFKRMD